MRHWRYGAFFGFGYSPTRALATVLIFFGMGIGGFNIASGLDLLVYQPDPGVNSVGDSGRLGYIKSDTDQYQPVVCNEDGIAYTIELMAPFLELHKAEKCDIRDDIKQVSMQFDPRGINQALKSVHLDQFWMWDGLIKLDISLIGRIFHTIYSVLGWLVLSLAILTFSGLLRQKERSN